MAYKLDKIWKIEEKKTQVECRLKRKSEEELTCCRSAVH